MFISRSSALAFAALAVASTACLGSPQEEPENSSLSQSFPFDLEQLSAAEADGAIRFEGAAGAALDVVEVWGVSLEAPAALAVAEVSADGAFAIEVPGAAPDRFRLHGVTSFGVEPADVVLEGGAVASVLDCTMALSQTEYVDLGAVAVGETVVRALALENACEQAITLIGSRALAATGAIELDLGLTATLLPLQPATVELRFTPLAVGAAIDYLTIDVQGHAAFVLTVRGRGL